MKTLTLFAVVVGLANAVLWGQVTTAQEAVKKEVQKAAGPDVKKWEYTSVYPDVSSLNTAGSEGWELVAVTTGQPGRPSQAFLKRPVR